RDEHPSARWDPAGPGEVTAASGSRSATDGSLAKTHAGKQIVHGQRLIGAPAGRAPADRVLAQRPAATIVMMKRLPNRQVTGGADVASPETTRHVPVSRPPPDAAKRGQSGNDLGIIDRDQRLVIDRAVAQGSGDTLNGHRLGRRELHRPERCDANAREHGRLGERVDVLATEPDTLPVALD